MDTYVVDTNVLLDAFLKREVASDIQEILQQAQQSKCALWIPQVVFFETAWVLSSFYKKEKTYIIQLLQTLLGIDMVMTENKEGLVVALDLYASTSSISFSDAYIIAFGLQKNPIKLLTGDSKLDQLYKKQLQNLRKR